MTFPALRRATAPVAMSLAIVACWASICSPADARSADRLSLAPRRMASAVVLNPMPPAVGAGEAVTVVSTSGGARLRWVSDTPLTCHGGGHFAAFYKAGRCRLSLFAGRRLVTRISTIVQAEPVGDADAASGVLTLTFDANASKISKVSKMILTEYADALENARRVLVMGHAANDGGAIDSPWAMRVSMLRAQRVAAFISGLGVKRSVVSTYWFANRLPVSGVSKRDNRRVTLVWVED